MKITHLDHLVLTVSDIDRTVKFYQSVMGMKKEVFDQGRVALKFGNQKINLHQLDQELNPKAGNICVGSADLCFIITTPINKAQQHLENLGIQIIKGPIQRTGAISKLISLYFRDPDQNLLEISNYL
ncbi:MAG: VOC family protein [Cyanobacteria bacterium P01_G01_bin.49]